MVDTFKDEADMVKSGLRVLMPYPDVKRARIALDNMAQENPDLTARPQNMIISHPSGGFAHFAFFDMQVRGYEYHEVGDAWPPTDEMRARVRLKVNDTKERSDG